MDIIGTFTSVDTLLNYAVVRNAIASRILYTYTDMQSRISGHASSSLSNSPNAVHTPRTYGISHTGVVRHQCNINWRAFPDILWCINECSALLHQNSYCICSTPVISLGKKGSFCPVASNLQEFNSMIRSIPQLGILGIRQTDKWRRLRNLGYWLGGSWFRLLGMF